MDENVTEPQAQQAQQAEAPNTDANEALRELVRKAEELLNIEEITLVYKGVKQPQTPSQVGVELAAVRNLIKLLEGRISNLELEWSVLLEKQRIVNDLMAQANAGKTAQ